MKQPNIFLYPVFVSDIQKAIEIGKNAKYNRVIVPITNPALSQDEHRQNDGQRHAFTRSDLLLDANAWCEKTILKISDANDCDSCDESIRRQSNQNLKFEIDWAKHQNGDRANVLVSLQNDQNANLARQLLNQFDRFGAVLVEVPIIDKSYYMQTFVKTDDKMKLSTASASVWQRWNSFRFTVDFNPQFNVALELTSILPSESDINRWCGEPVQLIIIPSDLFKMANNNNSIQLDECLQSVCLKFMRKTQTHFAVRCNFDDPWINSYAEYLRKLFSTACRLDASHVCNKINRILYDAGLIFSLNPNDTINRCEKYQKKLFGIYSQAIRLAIADRAQTEDKINLMVCGPDSWKLLSPLVVLIEKSNAVEIFIYEEDQNMQILISDIIESLYVDIPITIVGDSKTEKYHRKMDIVVAVTLSAIYESQWLQVTFNRVSNYIRSDAILIPKQSAVSVVPVLAANVYSYLQWCPQYQYRSPTHGFERHEIRSEVVCPVYTRNFYECSVRQELFLFQYQYGNVQILSDHRYKMLTFTIHQDCVVTGFCGYFNATFYKDIKLSNDAWLCDDNYDCVPMVYFPLRTPQVCKADTEMKIAFQLFGCVDRKTYWYEWQIIEPITMGATQNLCGKSCSFLYSSDQAH